jgi:hypothetical protein
LPSASVLLIEGDDGARLSKHWIEAALNHPEAGGSHEHAP